ncbi:AAA family ATPase [Novimethylophilus kurashikiensis]|uniref:AAA family ATPase n=1 Tax=Novimethylophilus kurashikiensis TaxID=1825523 RepID=A0A2R5F5A5_9PROT|nr:nucleotidyltransferase domain-containing protein [Novimethylophilus kurashikiensis]GBG13517.1 AAA family ATPase [Novimethylophilus kurashikiensis]
MQYAKPHPVRSFENLRDRVDRLIRPSKKSSSKPSQLLLDFPFELKPKKNIIYPSKSIWEFLNFICDAVPDGEVYLFGGVLRDMALLGKRGFGSDIDVVVEGAWDNCVNYLESNGAKRNKFGGFRLEIDGWPVDIWNAEETWAIKQGLVEYKSIASLTETTVLNWDAILMNWRTRSFICRDKYLEELRSRVLDVVLEKNPDPLGMVVRVFRHFCLKDARKISANALVYLANSTAIYSFETIKNREIQSYGNTMIAPPVYKFFAYLKEKEYMDLQSRYSVVSNILKKELDLSSPFSFNT